MKIGVFDSGVGGLSVAQAIERALPDYEVLFRNDSRHVPYGLRSPKEILGFVAPILDEMVAAGCQVIVIACNTVSTTLMDELHERVPVPLVAIVPMVKPAAVLSKTGTIAVCATPTTLASKRYAELKQEFAADCKVLEPDCSDWAAMIEQKLDYRLAIERRIQEVLQAGADVIVLGCTHYHWIEEEIRQLAGERAVVLQPEQAIIAQLKRVLARLP